MSQDAKIIIRKVKKKPTTKYTKIPIKFKSRFDLLKGP